MSDAIRSAANAAHPTNRTNDRIDHHAWWKRILYRVEHGDKTLLEIQIRMAQEAEKLAGGRA